MLVTCPECATRYEVDDAAFSAGGRAVRCNHCGCEWYQIGPARPAAASDAAAAQDAQAAMDDAPAAPVLEPQAMTAAPAAQSRAAAPQTAAAPSATARDGDSADFDAFRKRPGARRERRLGTGAPDAGRASPGARRADAKARRADAEADAAEPAAEAWSGDDDSLDLGRRLDADIRLPTLLDEDAAELRSAARRAPERRGGKGVALIGVALAAAAAIGAFMLAPNMIGAPAPTPERPAATAGAEIPAVDSVFASSGATTGAGIVFVEYNYALVERPEGPALEIWGVVANNGPQDVVSPTIEIVSRDVTGKALQTWYAQPEIDVLPIGESTSFKSRMMFPAGPVEDVDLYITN